MINWNQDQPIVTFLRRWVPTIFPVVHHHHPQGRGVGGYKPRRTAMGTFSFHSEGRAADIYVNAGDSMERQIGDGLFSLFIKWYTSLDVDHVIWRRQIWSAANGGPRPYPGVDAHTDHVHVAFTRAGSQRQPPFLIPLLDGLCLDIYGTLTGQDRVPPK
jgi:hypothetical protein